jgi:hypothetical protein
MAVSRRARLGLKVLVAYVIACLPLFWVASISGPHGPIMSKLDAALLALVMPWTETWQTLRGNLDLTPFIGVFFLLFIVGLIVVWLTERGRSEG